MKGQIIAPEDLSLIVRTLKLEYAKEGYLNAVIKPSLLQVSDTVNRVVLKLDIDEGKKVKVNRIQFYGNEAIFDDDFKGAMKETKERAWWKFWRTNKFDKKKYEEDKELLARIEAKLIKTAPVAVEKSVDEDIED